LVSPRKYRDSTVNYPTTTYFLQSAVQRRAIMGTGARWELTGSRLEECLRKGGGHLEDIVFKKQ